MTSTDSPRTPHLPVLYRLLFDLRLCLLLPLAFMAMFWACSAIGQPAPDTGQVTVEQPVRPHHPYAAASQN